MLNGMGVWIVHKDVYNKLMSRLKYISPFHFMFSLLLDLNISVEFCKFILLIEYKILGRIIITILCYFKIHLTLV